MAVLRKSLSAPRPPREYGPESAAIDARKIAEQNLLKLVPLDVFGLATALGLSVVSRPMDENTSGFLKRGADGWLLGVNSLHHINRQRFTVAHEIGHYMLHRDHGSFEDGLLFRKALQNSAQESEANMFASFLLMPDSELRRTATDDPIAIAIKFGVSQQAAKFRLDHFTNSVVYG